MGVLRQEARGAQRLLPEVGGELAAGGHGLV
jgi:hypothetical protein